jgi:hypothetical protein
MDKEHDRQPEIPERSTAEIPSADRQPRKVFKRRELHIYFSDAMG